MRPHQENHLGLTGGALPWSRFSHCHKEAEGSGALGRQRACGAACVLSLSQTSLLQPHHSIVCTTASACHENPLASGHPDNNNNNTNYLLRDANPDHQIWLVWQSMAARCDADNTWCAQPFSHPKSSYLLLGCVNQPASPCPAVMPEKAGFHLAVRTFCVSGW
jgi:hypothetical protein